MLKRTIYTDGGYSMKNKQGAIAYKFNKVHIEEIEPPEIEGLKQYSNLMELLAIKRAMEETTAKRIVLKTDSQIAQSWFERENNNLHQFSWKHFQLKKEIDSLKDKFNSVGICWIPRDENLAGQALEERLGL